MREVRRRVVGDCRGAMRSLPAADEVTGVLGSLVTTQLTFAPAEPL